MKLIAGLLCRSQHSSFQHLLNVQLITLSPQVVLREAKDEVRCLLHSLCAKDVGSSYRKCWKFGNIVATCNTSDAKHMQVIATVKLNGAFPPRSESLQVVNIVNLHVKVTKADELPADPPTLMPTKVACLYLLIQPIGALQRGTLWQQASVVRAL